MNKGNGNVHLMNLFKSVFVITVDLIDGKFVFAHSIDLTVLAQFNMFDVS